MLKSENPYNQILSGSIAFADILSAEAPVRRVEFSGESFFDHGGKLEWNSQLQRFILSVSHGQIDGLGLLRQLQDEFENWEASKMEGRREGEIGGFKYLQLLNPRSDSDHEQTFTQRFVSAIVDEFPGLCEQKMGMAVNLVPRMDPQIWGNGIAITRISGRKLRELAATDKGVWSESLRRLGRMTVERLRGGRAGSDSSFDSIVISSLGKLGPREIGPANAIVASTPLFAESGNLFLSCDRDVQSLVICAKADHWLFTELSRIEKLWRSQC